MKNTLIRGAASLVLLLASNAYSGVYQYLPAGDPNSGDAVITNDALSFSFTAASFLKIQGSGGLSVLSTGGDSPSSLVAYVLDSDGVALGRVLYKESQYSLSGAVTGLGVTAFSYYSSVSSPVLHIAGSLRIEMPAGEMPYAAIKGQTPIGMADLKGGFVEITNIELNNDSIFGTISGANGVVTQDHVLLWGGQCANAIDWFSCHSTARDVSEVSRLDLMSWAVKESSTSGAPATVTELFRQGLGLLSTNPDENPVDPAHPLGLMARQMPIFTGVTANVQFQSPIGYLPVFEPPLPVPEPGSMLLMGLGLIGVVTGVRRQAQLA